jgi:hypothetical protein
MQYKVCDQFFVIRARKGASFSLLSKENFEKRPSTALPSTSLRTGGTSRIKRDAGRPFFLVRRSRGEAGWFVFFRRGKKMNDKNEKILENSITDYGRYFRDTTLRPPGVSGRRLRRR